MPEEKPTKAHFVFGEEKAFFPVIDRKTQIALLQGLPPQFELVEVPTSSLSSDLLQLIRETNHPYFLNEPILESKKVYRIQRRESVEVSKPPFVEKTFFWQQSYPEYYLPFREMGGFFFLSESLHPADTYFYSHHYPSNVIDYSDYGTGQNTIRLLIPVKTITYIPQQIIELFIRHTKPSVNEGLFTTLRLGYYDMVNAQVKYQTNAIELWTSEVSVDGSTMPDSDTIPFMHMPYFTTDPIGDIKVPGYLLFELNFQGSGRIYHRLGYDDFIIKIVMSETTGNLSDITV